MVVQLERDDAICSLVLSLGTKFQEEKMGGGEGTREIRGESTKKGSPKQMNSLDCDLRRFDLVIPLLRRPFHTFLTTHMVLGTHC